MDENEYHIDLYHIDLQAVAEDVLDWQLAAQQLPLSDIRDLAAAARDGLAASLNKFNEVHEEAGGYVTPATVPLVTDVLLRAVMTAIFTLGEVCRTSLAAPSN